MNEKSVCDRIIIIIIIYSLIIALSITFADVSDALYNYVHALRQ